MPQKPLHKVFARNFYAIKNIFKICVNKSYREKKEVKGLISLHHLVVPSLRYMTSCMAEAVVYVLAFPLSSLKKVVKVNTKAKEYVWK